MEDKLKTLYHLQLIDDQLDLLEAMRGDLPGAVDELEMKLNGYADAIKKKEDEIEEIQNKKESNLAEMAHLNENLKRFKQQLYNVRNNKEYDALTKEIDASEELIKKHEAENESILQQLDMLRKEIEEVRPHLDELQEELKGKQADLKQIIKANEKEEAKLLEKRSKIEAQVKKPDYDAYMRIRKAKRGKAVVAIQRSACSGCHNVVPPQKQIEIRRNKQMFKCEYCGRILISGELADGVTL